MIITQEILRAARTEKGGYTKKQLAAIGIDWPPYNGWKTDVIGKSVSDEALAKFLEKPVPDVTVNVDTNIKRKDVSIYVYEHCETNNSASGQYDVLLTTAGKELKLSKSFTEVNSNRVIIQGAIDAIGKLKQPCRIELYTTTVFGLAQVLCNDGSWREERSTSVNDDLLQILKKVVVDGQHMLVSKVNKSKVLAKLFPNEKRFFSVGVKHDVYERLVEKCKTKHISLFQLTSKLLTEWVEKE